jgi:hypothetical protein
MIIRTKSDCYSDGHCVAHLPETCLLCGEAISLPAIYWSASHDIAAHPDCIEHFAWGVLRDVWELKCGRGEASSRYHVLMSLCGLKVRPFKGDLIWKHRLTGDDEDTWEAFYNGRRLYRIFRHTWSCELTDDGDGIDGDEDGFKAGRDICETHFIASGLAQHLAKGQPEPSL